MSGRSTPLTASGSATTGEAISAAPTSLPGAPRACSQSPVRCPRCPVRALGAPGGSSRTGRTWVSARCGESACRAPWAPCGTLRTRPSAEDAARRPEAAEEGRRTPEPRVPEVPQRFPAVGHHRPRQPEQRHAGQVRGDLHDGLRIGQVRRALTYGQQPGALDHADLALRPAGQHEHHEGHEERPRSRRSTPRRPVRASAGRGPPRPRRDTRRRRSRPRRDAARVRRPRGTRRPRPRPRAIRSTTTSGFPRTVVPGESAPDHCSQLPAPGHDSQVETLWWGFPHHGRRAGRGRRPGRTTGTPLPG